MEPEITYFENGQKYREAWYKDGIPHRDDGHARIFWYENGQKRAKCWLSNGKHHRLDGPAIQSWHKNGQKWSEEWYIDGKYYNTIQDYANALVERGYKSKEEALFILLKWS